MSELNESIAYTDHIFKSQAPPFSNLICFQLSTALTIALLICLACSRVKIQLNIS